MGSRESSVGECGIIGLDFIISMQPETILLIRAQKPVFSMMGSGESGVVRWGMWNYWP